MIDYLVFAAPALEAGLYPGGQVSTRLFML